MKDQDYHLFKLGYWGALSHVAILLVTVLFLHYAVGRSVFEWIPLVLWLLFLLGMYAKYLSDTRVAKDGGA